MHDQMIDDASSVTEHRATGRKRSVAVLLAAVVAMVTIVAGAGAASATAPLPLANPTGISAANPGDTTGADLAVTWTAPVPPDNTTGFRIDVYDGASLSESIFIASSSLKLNTANNTYSFTVGSLTPGHTYQFQVASLNGEGNTTANGEPGGSDLAAKSTGVIAPPKFTVTTPPATPFNYATAEAAIKQDYEDFLGRQPSFSELVLWEAYFQTNPESCSPFIQGSGSGPFTFPTLSPADYALYCPNEGGEYDLITFLRNGGSVNDIGTPPSTITNPFEYEPSETFAGDSNPIVRLYFAYFNRVADYGGLKTWINKERNGTSVDAISTAFAKSSEFQRTYGSLSNGDFVTLVYFNVLGRAPDFGGQNFWLNQLASGRSRGFVMDNFAQSSENKNNLAIPVTIVGDYAAELYRVPSSAELFAERAEINQNGGGTSAFRIFQGKVRDSAEYAKRTIQATPWNPIKAA